uniref:C-type lectin domain containing 5A n=1 Tax=Sphenodon punctatus TaxID=8508 RepID=A0A8D0L3A2_SPHPU
SRPSKKTDKNPDLSLLLVSEIFPTPGSPGGTNSPIDDSKGECPILWTFYKGRCYFFSAQQKTWADSRKHCVDSGSDLVIINSREELAFLFNHTQNEVYFIGLTDQDAEGKWKWIDNTALNINM